MIWREMPRASSWKMTTIRRFETRMIERHKIACDVANAWNSVRKKKTRGLPLVRGRCFPSKRAYFKKRSRRERPEVDRNF
uniref:Uncharacterized protein n=1 Tax=Candidatus Kentrum sp. TC TaxID=2126339 RepID=A0A450Z9B4_9GAMM|nr:MAG: hypothetical protein BECKTC1821D_GA0114238_11018 [Candidatus Kentron sp. TC]